MVSHHNAKLSYKRKSYKGSSSEDILKEKKNITNNEESE